MNSREIPQIRHNPILGSLIPFRKDRLGFLCRAAEEQGDVARTRIGAVPILILSSPELVREVLIDKVDAFMKGPGLAIFAKPLLGNGLLTSEGQEHRRQRRRLGPAFTPKRLAGYAPVMSERAEALASSLHDGDVVDVSVTMMRLALEIAGKTLFGSEVGEESVEIAEAITTAMEYMISSMDSVIPLPPSVPTPARKRVEQAIARLDETVYRIIRERRALGEDLGDFLSMLLLARDEDDASMMSDKQVRDEAMTIFIAGHETTANALAWTYYLLAQHPDVRARLEREVDEAFGGRSPTLSDLAKVPYALMVFKEAMRLYPPAYTFARRAIRDVMIGDVLVKKNHILLVNIIGMHHRSAYFPEPHRFDPERFAPEAEKKIPRLAYMPFSAGPRVCIGNQFALMEGQMVLATLAQRLRFDRLRGCRRVAPVPLVTLRPGSAMMMRVSKRS